MSKHFQLMIQDLRKQEFTDCTFVFVENDIKKTLAAHKNFLACISPVFKSMFYGSLKEESEVLVEDVSYETFEQLLSFLYTEELKLVDAYEACNFYYVAKKCDICTAVEAVRVQMFSKMSVTTSLVYFGTAKLFEDNELLRQCKSQLEPPIYNATKAPNFFKDTAPLTLNDKVLFNATGSKTASSGLKTLIETIETEIFSMESYEDIINETLALVRTLVVEAKDILKMIISEKIAVFEASLNLVPATSTFFQFNKICSTKKSFNCCNKRLFSDCECCIHWNKCNTTAVSSDVVKLILQKYANNDLSTFWFEDVQTIFNEYESKVNTFKAFS